MQENDAENAKCRRYRPRRRSVRRIYFGRVVALVCALCFAVCAAMLIFASKNGSVNVMKIKSEEYFFVTTASTEFVSDASEKALALKNAGGAGYILNDGNFHVAAAVYLSKGDAATVAKRLCDSGISALVYELSTSEVKVGYSDDKSRNAKVSELFSYPKTLVGEIESLSRSVDASEISEPLALLTAEKLRSKTRNKAAEAESLDGDFAPALWLMYARFDNAFENCLAFGKSGGVRSAVKELACAVAAENVFCSRNIIA